MTIPEAVGLVLQAMSYANGGEIEKIENIIELEEVEE